MIKVTRHETNPSQVLFRIEGELTSDTLGQLRDLITSEVHAPALTLELSGLATLDMAGRAFLMQLRDYGHTLRGGSLYIKRLLEEGQA